MRLASIAAAAAVLFAAGAASAQVTARLVPSRTSGVAPLSVFLDGSTSQASGANSIHDLHYDWDFGDAGSGSWPHSGVSRNEATGPWSGHVFEQPGSYTVTLTVTAPNGSRQSVSRTIQVGDPNSVYSGSKTICFSSSGNFSGCPAGAQRTTTSSFTSALGQVATNRRLLFRRGETFSSTAQVDVNTAGPGTVGAYGTGAAPRINVSHDLSAIRLSWKKANAHDWRFMDLDFVSTTSDPGGIVGSNAGTSNILFLRLSGSGFHGNIGFGPDGPNYYGDPLHHDISVVECNFGNHRGGNGATGLFMAVDRMLILGNSIEDTQQIEHVVRFPFVGGGVISHNYLARPARNKHIVKLHALGNDKSFPKINSHNILISNNVFQSGLDGWAVVIGPQNSFSDERVDNAIIERNLFLGGAVSQTYVFLNGEDHTVRNNIFNMNGGNYHTAVTIEQRGIEPPPRRARIYNNTCHTTDNTGTAYCVFESADSQGTLVANNLLYAPNADRKDIISTRSSSTTLTNNVVATSSPYAVSNPSTAGHFRLKSNASSIDAGANLGWASSDFAGLVRPASGSWDVGAYETGGSSGGGGSGPTPPAAPVLLP